MVVRLFILFALIISSSVNAQIEFTLLSTPTVETLKAIRFYDSNIGYTCGDAGVILKTIDGGETWVSLDSETNVNLWDLDIIPNSAGQGIMVVGDNNTVLKSIDGGESWNAQFIPFLAGSFVFGIQCLDSLNYFACGGDFATTTGAILKTVDGGANWSKNAVTSSVFLDKIFMINPTEGYAVGTFSSFNDGSISKTTDGLNFNNVQSSSSIITNVWGINDSTIIAVGLAGQVWRSSNAGSSWVNQSISTNFELYDICFVDAFNGIACGGNQFGGAIRLTDDGGLTWSPVLNSFNGTFLSLATTDSHVFICGVMGTIIKGEYAIPSGIDLVEKNKSHITFPNPAVDYFCVESAKNFDAEFQFYLFNSDGKKVMVKPSEGGKLFVNSKQLASGFYLYKIQYQDGTNEEGKILIR